MTNFEFVLLVLLLALATALTRFLPFIVFGSRTEVPKFVEYLGKVLPSAMMGLLVVYCFKDVDFLNYDELIPLLCASVSVIIVHLWKHNTIISITLGTIIYMILIRI